MSPQSDYNYAPPSSNYGGASSPNFMENHFDSKAQHANTNAGSFVPPSQTLIDSYKRSNGDFGPLNAFDGKRQNSALFNMGDSVAVHLLVETAKGDSQEYEILPFEELESLKKEQRVLQSRIESVARKLALEAKLRDAAQSLNRLYSKKTDHQRAQRTSVGRRLSQNGGRPDPLEKAGSEAAASAKKCDELSKELWDLEARNQHVQMRILRHTAGVLQLTHKGPTGRSENSRSLIIDGVTKGARPDSPASIFTYDLLSSRSQKFEDGFDERSLYRSPENIDSFVDHFKTGNNMGMKDGSNSEINKKILLNVERKLKEFNDRLRDLVVSANPDREKDFSRPPKPNENQSQSLLIENHLEYLDQGLLCLSAEQGQLQKRSKLAMNAVEGRLEGISNQIYGMVNSSPVNSEQNYPPPPGISGKGAQEQINYLEDGLYAIDQIRQSLEHNVADARSRKTNQTEEYDTILTGLWDIILANEEEARERKRQTRKLIENDPEAVQDFADMSPDEDVSHDEPFSIQAFSSKVQRTFSQYRSVKEKQGILRRQIHQQRELNAKADTEKGKEVEELSNRLREATQRRQDAEKELHNVADEMVKIRALDEKRNAASSEAIKSERQARQQAEASIADLQQKLQSLNDSMRKAEASGKDTATALQRKENELRELESKVVELQTEVTVARAELDGAYGSRAQRAAEASANPELKKELADLSAKNTALESQVASLAELQKKEKILRDELTGMASEHEAIMRDAIQNEKEREKLEGMVERLRDEKERLELDLSDEKVKLLGVKSPSAISQSSMSVSGEATSVRMLREDFRRMMKERTAESLKALRVSTTPGSFRNPLSYGFADVFS